MRTKSDGQGERDWSAERVIATVLGPVPADRLGPTDCHEHLLITGGLPVVLEPDFRLDDVDAAVRELDDLWAAGGAAVVDCMPMGVGRDPDGLVKVAERSRSTVIAVSGFHRDRFYAEDHWVRRTGLDAITGRVVDDVTLGMERGTDGSGERSAARPGLIKVATTGEPGTPLENRLLEAVGLAAVQTDLPVITHTDSMAGARRQIDRLQGWGVRPERVILSHMDRHGGVDEVAELCSTGATVCLDWLGRLDRRPDQVVADLVVGLIDRGHADRIVLGQDLARRQYWRAYGGGPGLRHLFGTVVPLLRRNGIGEADLEQILVHTPRRVLSVQPD